MTAGLKDKRILVGVCGSIAAFKACELVRALRKEGADVTVAITLTAGRRPNGQSSPTLALHSAVWATRSRAA